MRVLKCPFCGCQELKPIPSHNGKSYYQLTQIDPDTEVLHIDTDPKLDLIECPECHFIFLKRKGN